MKNQPSAPGSLSSRRKFLGQIAAGTAAFSIISSSKAQPAAPRKLGVAIVGLGGYATDQIKPALKLTEHCELRGVVTGSAAKGQQWAREVGFPEKNVWNYQTMSQIADAKDIDIVYVITPNSLHAEEVITAAKAGKHVISEKPFTTTVADAERAIAACKAANVKLSIGYRLHFDPIHQEFIRLAKDPSHGPFTKMKGEFSFVMNGRPWRAQKQWAGGGPVMDLGVYVFQEACMGAGGVAPIAVTAKPGPITKPEIFQDVEQTMNWTLEFPNGATAECTASYSQNANRFRAEAANGEYFEFLQGGAFMYTGVRAVTKAGIVLKPVVNQQARQMDDFALCIRENRESRVSGEMGLRDMKIIEAIYASAANNGARTLIKA